MNLYHDQGFIAAATVMLIAIVGIALVIRAGRHGEQDAREDAKRRETK
jgi:hypothetical protein